MSAEHKSDGLTALASLFVRRPVFTIVVNLLLIVAGLAAFNSVEIRELPNVDRPVISITTTFEGASAEAVDRQLTSEIEGAVARVSGIASISSSSRFGNSRVTVEFTDATDLNVAASDVRDAVAGIANRLPEDADESRIVKADANADSIMRLAILSDSMKIEDLTTLVEDRIADRVAAVEGVADVTLSGEREKLIYVDVRPDELATRGLTLADVTAALGNAAFDQPAGSLEGPTQNLVVRADANLSTPDDFGAVLLNADTRLRDVASVRFGPDEAASQLRVNGETGIGLDIIRQAGSSTIAISEGVRQAVAELNASLPAGTRMVITSDEATFINGSIHEVELTLALAIVIVVAVIYAFLMNFRATLIPTVTIPIALIGVVAGVYLVGFSLNIITLLALVLATGMVVDDAIIVLENIIRRRDMGMSVKAAAVLGTREVFFAVISTTATLAAVFIPISFLPGVAGGLFREFGFVLAISVTLSAFIALTLCPMLAAHLLPERDAEARPGFVKRGAMRLGEWLAGLYAFLLRGALNNALLMVVASLIFAGASVFTFQGLQQQLTPTEDRGSVLMSITAPQSASLQYTDDQMRRIEEIVLPYVESGEATSIFARIGTNAGNSAFMVMTLTPWGERMRTQQEIAAELNVAFRDIPGVQARAIQPNSLGIRGGGRGLQFAVAGPTYGGLSDVAEELEAAMNADGRWGRVQLAFDTTQPQLSVKIDRARASDLGIEIDGLAAAMQSLLDGREIATTYVDDRSVPIHIVSTSEPINDPGDLANIYLKTKDGRFVPMSTIAEITEEAIAPTLARENQSRSVAMSADLHEGYSIGQGWADVQAFAVGKLPADMRLVPLAEAATLEETSNGLALVFGFAIVIVFLVLSAQFESFVSALIIIATVPFGVACAIYAMAFFGETLNLYSQIGLVLLVGIMAKNGILIVEFANQLREGGAGVREAIEQASIIRLRPVMMTMIATIVGGVPLMFSAGAGAEARVSLGYVIVGGLGLATVATLFLTPVAYLALARFSKPNVHATSQLQRDISEAERMGLGGEAHG
ncbi:efflux RND transporter permease subunit [Aureimonas pseudogalii]|uniref:HAE1 family hydrophobic/amphiphilic exporter-1 n=1 Tax=Aureimonas pseudogalii TaxID=1744844 RepID=A0A7W6EE99_9HYPH|nr:efflux RND transporter permease subunit [Aureimonas pseudogalii]MBB3996194.1 HAE1 family hydrophobic/amphiphilic exporter-1 [Aureimonas pseudogalii]